MSKRKNKKGNKKGKQKGLLNNVVDLTPKKVSQTKKTNSTIEQQKKTWYKSGTFIGIISGLLITLIIFFIQTEQSSQSTTQIIENVDKNKDTIVTIIHEAVKQLKKNPEEVISLLKQPKTSDEYENDKLVQIKKFEELKRLNEKYMNEKLDSLFNEAGVIIKGINYINNTRWSELFDGGYAIFTIGINKKIYIYPGSFKSDIDINWQNIMISEVTETGISIALPRMYNKKNFVIVQDIGLLLERRFENLNKIFLNDLLRRGINIYSGIIADNEMGIIGIIGFGDGSKNLENEFLLDFDNLQKVTQIDFKGDFYH